MPKGSRTTKKGKKQARGASRSKKDRDQAKEALSEAARAKENRDAKPDGVSRPDAQSRRHILIGVGVVLALQLLIPLRYYCGNDPYDERFSWRMYSTVRVVRCSTLAEQVTEGRPPVRLAPRRMVHEKWYANMQRNRGAATTAFLAFACDSGGDEVRVTNTCNNAVGQRMPVLVWSRDCVTGSTEVPTDEQLAVHREQIDGVEP